MAALQLQGPRLTGPDSNATVSFMSCYEFLVILNYKCVFVREVFRIDTFTTSLDYDLSD